MSTDSPATQAESPSPAGQPGPPTEAPADFIWKRKHLLGLEELSAEEILHIFKTAESFQEVSMRSIKKVPALRGRVVVNLFFEDSTRTRMSFALAAQRLSADVLDFSVAKSSVTKGESLPDTVLEKFMGVFLTLKRGIRMAETWLEWSDEVAQVLAERKWQHVTLEDVRLFLDTLQSDGLPQPHSDSKPARKKAATRKKTAD